MKQPLNLLRVFNTSKLNVMTKVSDQDGFSQGSPSIIQFLLR